MLEYIESIPPSPRSKVVADFGVSVDYPLIKSKFAVYNSGLVPLARYVRDIERVAEVKPDSLRVDLHWGSPHTPYSIQPVTGTADAPVFHFEEMDGIATLLNSIDVQPYWSYCYMPLPLQKPAGVWQNPPSDPEAWGRILGAVAAHYRNADPPNPIGYHEVYNEPDNPPYFFRGTVGDYLTMYDHGVRAIRGADPDAIVGGPALAFDGTWVAPFLDYVRRHELPLDFFSFHFYGRSSWDHQRLPQVLEMLRKHLASRPEFATTEMHLNEYNAYYVQYPEGGTQDRYYLASALLADFSLLLSQPDLTLVHWAQFLDSGGRNYSGMVSSGGHRKAVFNAYKIYGMMPVDRRRVHVDGPQGLGGMASSDAHQAGLVVWNQTRFGQVADVILDGIPFPRGTFRVYRIDKEHASWGDDACNEVLTPVETRANGTTVGLRWSGEIPRDGVVYLEVVDGTEISELAPNRVATVKRVLHYYPDRTKKAYADFDRNTWIARLGMATEEYADEEVGVAAQEMPEVLDATFEVEGTLRKVSANSLVGLRVDYAVDGIYTKGLLFHGPYAGSVDLYDAARSAAMPWGTKQREDQEIAVPNLSRFRVPIAELSPEGWRGSAQITAIMQDAGVGTRAKVTLRKG